MGHVGDLSPTRPQKCSHGQLRVSARPLRSAEPHAEYGTYFSLPSVRKQAAFDLYRLQARSEVSSSDGREGRRSQLHY